ncbi:response regulator [Rhizobacter sp. Root1221]|uniref:response regulator n=1 Tax=Rhizobacter sp. Root1221 TaxID=1736433 RepID=UPI0006F936A6|nr:response regulator [Rhizobacter sp. Root1221]KQW00643.1 hypothetical protein ASC87_17445 [Rhizobacter sp. Root1221]
MSGSTPLFRHPVALVVDDDPASRQLTAEALRLFGVVCDSAANGLEALQRINERRYEIVFMDGWMPQLDGWQATRCIRLEEARQGVVPRMPIIAVTAGASRGEVQGCLDAGMDDALVKPIDFRLLRQVLDRWLARSPHTSNFTPCASGSAVE